MLTSSDWTMINTNTNTAVIITSTSTTLDTSSTGSSGLVSNPNATLDRDAFLKLLLIKPQHQDPTGPMDSNKMLTQASQLSALGMQQNINTTMQKMVETTQLLSDSFSTSMSTSAIGVIGKMAIVSDNKIKLTGSDEIIALKMYLPEGSDGNGATLEVYDNNNKPVFSEESGEQSVSQGLSTMEWPGRNNSGVYAGDGECTVKMVYNNKNGEKTTVNYSTYPIEGVVFKEGAVYAKMAGQEVPFDVISEITDYKLSSSSSTGSGSSGSGSGGDPSGSTEDSGEEEKA